jgi:hypothetical protein
MTDLSQAIWRKARRSSHNGGCVEIAANLEGVAAVRDSKRPEGGAHVVGPGRVCRVPGGREEGPLRPDVVVTAARPPAGCSHRGANLCRPCLEALPG